MYGVTGLEAGAVIVALLAGVALGLVLRRGSRASRARIRQLEGEVREGRERLEAQQEAVTKHFGQTSELFGDLTRQYTALYAHLAEGARDLCDDIPELGRGFSDPLLPAAGDASSGEEAGIASAAESSQPGETQATDGEGSVPAP